MCLSGDEALVAVTTNKGAKIWNRFVSACLAVAVRLRSALFQHVLTRGSASRHCVRTLDAGYGLCCAFAPGNRHLIVGTKVASITAFRLGSNS